MPYDPSRSSYKDNIHGGGFRRSRQIKLTCPVLGSAGAGKTSICRRYFHDIFEAGYRNPTLGSDFYTGRISCPADSVRISQDESESTHVSLQVWDTPGKERYAVKPTKKYSASLSDSFFRHADAIMLVYDMTSSTSFTRLLKWYGDLMVLTEGKPLPILIVANKLDVFVNDQEHSPFYPRRVPQRDVLGLDGNFTGDAFRYEYRVSDVKSPAQSAHGRMEISSYLANRENWTTDGSYLDSLLNSEDGSHPDREMVLLWCMRNGLKHMEVSAASGEGVNAAITALVEMALDARQRLDIPDLESPVAAIGNKKLDLHDRYARQEENCCFALLRPFSHWSGK